MPLGEFCTREVVTASVDTSVYEAAQLMRHHHVGTVVVVQNRDGRELPVGIITDRDIVLEIVAPGLDPEVLTIGDIMSAELMTVKESVGLFARWPCAAFPSSATAAIWSVSSPWTTCWGCCPKNCTRWPEWSRASNRRKYKHVVDKKGVSHACIATNHPARYAQL